MEKIISGYLWANENHPIQLILAETIFITWLILTIKNKIIAPVFNKVMTFMVHIAFESYIEGIEEECKNQGFNETQIAFITKDLPKDASFAELNDLVKKRIEILIG